MSFVSHAQNFEDVLLWRALHGIEDGRYLDVGAQDPVIDSVSLAFYEAGWRGIHVEPTPYYAARLRDARPDEIVIEAAVTDATGPLEFYEIPETGLSTGKAEVASRQAGAGFAARKILVPSVRLDQLLETVDSELHWLKIDVEGMEADVLRSWGQNRRRPWLLVVESTFPGTQQPTEQQWIEEVLQRGYKPVFFDGLSRYFVHDSQKEMAAEFAAPVNVFDRFVVTGSHFSARELVTELQSTRESAAEGAARLRTEIDELRASGKAIRDERDRAHAQIETAVRAQRVAIAERELARDKETQAQRRLVAAEQKHQSAIDALWRERQQAEDELRRAGLALEQGLREDLRRAEAAGAEARRDLARIEERSALQSQMLAQVDKALADAARQGADSREQAVQLRALLDQRQSSIAKADALIRAVISERGGRWQAIGQALGLARPSPAVQALSGWTALAHETLGRSNVEQTDGIAKAGTSMTEPPATVQPNPYLRADSLAELIGWHDIDFVRCAYVTILGRQPDPEGEAHYTRLVREGRSKFEVLWDLRRSEEGRRHDPGIAGLDRELKRAARARSVLVGSLVRPFSRMPSDSGRDRQLRALENALYVLARDQQAAFRDLKSTIMMVQPAVAGRRVEGGESPAAISGLSQRASEIFAAMSPVR